MKFLSVSTELLGPWTKYLCKDRRIVSFYLLSWKQVLKEFVYFKFLNIICHSITLKSAQIKTLVQVIPAQKVAGRLLLVFFFSSFLKIIETEETIHFYPALLLMYIISWVNLIPLHTLGRIISVHLFFFLGKSLSLNK